MTSSLLIILLFVLILYGFIVSIRYPHIRKMALRNLSASKSSTALTVLGLVVSTSLITLLVTVIYSLEKSADAYLDHHYGPIHYEVHSVYQQSVPFPYFNEEDIEKLKSSLDEESSSVLPIISYTVSLFAQGEEDKKQKLMFPNIHVIGADLRETRSFDQGQLAANLPSSLPIDQVIISRLVANKLKVDEGDSITILDHDQLAHTYMINRVVDDAGLAGYPGLQLAKASVILSLEASRQLFGLTDGLYNSVLVAGAPPPNPWSFIPVKGNASEELYGAISFISYLLGITSLNALIMGLVLMVNLFKLIIDERRLENGILRSIGFSHVDLKRMLRLEVLFFGVLSGVFGAAAGLGMGAMLTSSLSSKFGPNPEIQSVYQYFPSVKVILAGCSLGLSIIFICTWAMTNRTAKRSVVELRNVTFKSNKRHEAGARFSWYNWYAFIVLVVLIGMAAILFVPEIRRMWFSEKFIPILTAWIFILFPLLSFASVRWLELSYNGLSFLFRRTPALYGMLRLVIRNIKQYWSRSGMMILMFSTVSSFIVVFVILSFVMQMTMKQSDHRQLIGGYDLYAYDYYSYNGDVTDTDKLGIYLEEGGFKGSNQPQWTTIVQLPWKIRTSKYGDINYSINGIDHSYAETTNVALLQYDPSYKSEREAWAEVAKDPNVIIVSSSTLALIGDRYGIGDTVALTIGSKTVSKRIIGIAQEIDRWYAFTFGIWMNHLETIELGREHKGLYSVLLMRFPTEDLAREQLPQVQQALAKYNIAPVHHISDYQNKYYQTSTMLMNYFGNLNKLAIGIGIIGLAVVLTRISKQRRRQLGMLRAIGIPSKWLTFCIWAEGMILAIIGITIGIFVGLAFGYIIGINAIDQAGYQLLAYKLLDIFGIVILVVAGVTAFSAWSVHRIPPTEATKYVHL